MEPTPTFVDRVMDVLGSEPAAGPGRALDQAVRERSLRDAHDSVRVAWRLVFLRAMPRIVRLQAAALVLVVASALAAGSALATVAAVQTVAPIVLADHPADDARAVPPAVMPTPSPTAIPAPTGGDERRPIVLIPAVLPRVVEPAPTAEPDGKTAGADELEDKADKPSATGDRDHDTHAVNRDDESGGDRDDGDAADREGGGGDDPAAGDHDPAQAGDEDAASGSDDDDATDHDGAGAQPPAHHDGGGDEGSDDSGGGSDDGGD